MAGERILIIEDDPEYVEFLLTEVLSPLGFPAQAATNGATGLSAAQEERPALVLLNLGLDDVAYPEMLQQLQNSGDPPVILLTPPGAEAKALHAVRLGARDAVMQPSGTPEISRAITRVLHQERVARERDQLVRKLAAANEALEQSLAEQQELCDLCKTISSCLDLEQVLTAVVHAATSMTRAEEGYLLLKDPENGKLYLRALQSPDEKQATTLCVPTIDSIARHVMRTGEPVVLSNRDGIAIKVGSRQSPYSTGRLVRSLVNVPLQRQLHVIGVLAVNNDESDRTFSQSDVLLLSALADVATIAIGNAQRYACADLQLSHALEELAAVQHKTDLVLEHISEGVVTVDEDLYITSVNAAIERITGWQASELLGRRYEEVLSPLVEEHSPAPEQTMPRRALDSQTAVGPISATLRHKDGGQTPAILTATSIRASDASVTGALVTVRGLTQGTNWDSRHQEMLDMLDSQGLQLDQLTEETLDTLHMEAGTALPHCHPVTLKPIVSQIIKNYQETGSGGGVRVALAPDLPFAMGNESQIELALLNLVENARGPNADEQPVVISADVQDDRIVISVEGPGSAVPPEQHEHPSNSLRSSDNSGASSGDQPPWWILPQIRLFIARKLIQAQGGQFWTENQSGTTVRFHFSLPKIEVSDDAQALID